MNRYALISVSDKSGLEDIARALVDAGVQLVSTSGTLKQLESLGFEVTPVEAITDFPEMMDGRVKTLHPKIHGGLLANRANKAHLAELEKHHIPNFEFVVVNLYPFKKVLMQQGATDSDKIENIDIGGPSMLRSAAKNFQTLSVITDPRDYGQVIKELETNNETTLSTRRYLASKVYQLTSYYDSLIADFMNEAVDEDDDKIKSWSFLTQSFEHKETLRYGENSHQTADFYTTLMPSKATLAGAKQLSGKHLSYNNLRDADVALALMNEFDQPTAVALKHMNPCGVGVAKTIEDAFDYCYQADSVSIFGGILSFNRPVTAELAKKINQLFIEIVIAPRFEKEAFAILTQKKNVRLLEVDLLEDNEQRQWQQTSVSGGLLVQSADHTDDLTVLTDLPNHWSVAVGEVQTTEAVQAMSFLMKVCAYVKSNAIVVGGLNQTYGIGAGQMNRVQAAKIALEAMLEKDRPTSEPLILASDAFIPMRDTIDLAATYNVDIIVQPGGSIRDKEVIQAAKEHGITLVMTGTRHFKH